MKYVPPFIVALVLAFAVPTDSAHAANRAKKNG